MSSTSGLATKEPSQPPPSRCLSPDHAAQLLSVLSGDAEKYNLFSHKTLSQHLQDAVDLAVLLGPFLLPRQRVLDLGSGSGIVGLAGAFLFPEVVWYLVDCRQKCCDSLEKAVQALGIGNRVHVLFGRAEALGRNPAHRHQYHAVVARRFGPPSVTAECAAPLLCVNGFLMVTDPRSSTEQHLVPNRPGDISVPAAERWPAGGVGLVGLQLQQRHANPAVSIFRSVRLCGTKYPRSRRLGRDQASRQHVF
eukprot:gb/GEZN01015213.1/.p1 GENE.gb/GEZN01015213.1/~~gb/GEZN01015213.1/.p1  ORF type:complete len:291 (-),score=20.22 gb/GEZN01015213.1/:36-785(-)